MLTNGSYPEQIETVEGLIQITLSFALGSVTSGGGAVGARQASQSLGRNILSIPGAYSRLQRYITIAKSGGGAQPGSLLRLIDDLDLDAGFGELVRHKVEFLKTLQGGVREFYRAVAVTLNRDLFGDAARGGTANLIQAALAAHEGRLALVIAGFSTYLLTGNRDILDHMKSEGLI